MSIDGKRRLAAAGFVTLLLLSVFWPAPVVAINELCCHAPLAVDDLSFLGREAPSWDVIFWCIAGLFALALVLPARGQLDTAAPAEAVRRLRVDVRRIDLAFLLLASAAVAIAWRFADAPVTAWAERIQSDNVEDAIRIANRFGGGMNPAMIVIFFLLAGIAFARRRWVVYGVTMAVAGAAAGILGQVVKYAVGRTRPELWLGPFRHARAAATSFPSGHTVGAFALAGVLLFLSPSKTMRIVALILAAAVGVSRVLAFRHWSSDVLASAAIGLLVSAIVCRSVRQLTSGASADL